MNEQDIADINSQIRQVTGDLPSYPEIEEHFVKPFNEELAEEKGENVDIFYGCHPAEKRLASYVAAQGRVENKADDDTAPEREPVYTPPQAAYVPPTPLNYYTRDEDLPAFEGNDLEDYTRYVLDQAATRFERAYSEQRAQEKIQMTEAGARAAHNGKDGLPTYDEVFDGYTVPLIRQRPEVYQWLMAQPNPAEASFLVGCLRRYPHLSDVLQSQGPDAFFEYIKNGSSAPPPSVRARGGRHKPGELSKARIEAMTPTEFEAELLAFKNS